MSQNYTPEFKKKIVRLHEEEGRTYKSITDEYGVSKSSISKWCSEFSEHEDELALAAEAKAKYGAKRAPEPSRAVSAPTYRPSYVPPAPMAAFQKKPVLKVDTSGVQAGTIVTHKAFGTGEVKGIGGGLIVVAFSASEKKSQFPGAFEQGFLKLDE